MNEIEYESLRLDVLQKMIEIRSLPYKVYKKDNDTKKSIIEMLKQDDAGKFIWETTHERCDGGYVIGIDVRNKKHISEINKLIEKKEARRLDRYCDNRIQFWCTQKLI